MCVRSEPAEHQTAGGACLFSTTHVAPHAYFSQPLQERDAACSTPAIPDDGRGEEQGSDGGALSYNAARALDLWPWERLRPSAWVLGRATGARCGSVPEPLPTPGPPASAVELALRLLTTISAAELKEEFRRRWKMKRRRELEERRRAAGLEDRPRSPAHRPPSLKSNERGAGHARPLQRPTHMANASKLLLPKLRLCSQAKRHFDVPGQHPHQHVPAAPNVSSKSVLNPYSPAFVSRVHGPTTRPKEQRCLPQAQHPGGTGQHRPPSVPDPLQMSSMGAPDSHYPAGVAVQDAGHFPFHHASRPMHHLHGGGMDVPPLPPWHLLPSAPWEGPPWQPHDDPLHHSQHGAQAARAPRTEHGVRQGPPRRQRQGVDPTQPRYPPHGARGHGGGPSSHGFYDGRSPHSQDRPATRGPPHQAWHCGPPPEHEYPAFLPPPHPYYTHPPPMNAMHPPPYPQSMPPYPLPPCFPPYPGPPPMYQPPMPPHFGHPQGGMAASCSDPRLVDEAARLGAAAAQAVARDMFGIMPPPGFH